MLDIKPGVDLSGLRPEMLVALQVASEVFAQEGHRCTVTSARDGKHNAGSLHYVGLAVDLRTSTAGIERPEARRIVSILRSRLGAQYDVVAEYDHIHIEFQPKEALL
jgi:hypothetical protein